MPYRLKQVLQALKSQQGVKACGGTLTTPPANAEEAAATDQAADEERP